MAGKWRINKNILRQVPARRNPYACDPMGVYGRKTAGLI